MSEHESTYPPHDCREVLQMHYHNQDDATYSTCGVCGKVTAFAWKHSMTTPTPPSAIEADRLVAPTGEIWPRDIEGLGYRSDDL